MPAYAEYLSLIAFNLGVELGQLAFVACVTLVAAMLNCMNRDVLGPVQSAAVWLIGVSSAYWLVERTLAFYN